MPENSLADILKDKILGAEHSPLVTNWADGVQKQFANLGMASHFRLIVGTNVLG